MLLRTVHAVSPDLVATDAIVAPLELRLAPDVYVSLGAHGPGFGLLVDRVIDPSAIEVLPSFHTGPDGHRGESPSLKLADSDGADGVVVDDFLSAVGFVSGVPLVLGTVHERRFVPEGSSEERLLEEFGTDRPLNPTGVSMLPPRTFGRAKADVGAVTALLERAPGVRLYRDAQGLPPVPQFRELWRVLESAFAAEGAELVRLMAAFRPVQKLGFDRAELNELYVLRCRASHAHSRAAAGTAELIAVAHDCGAKVSRLHGLVERVVVTKKSWGYPTDAVEELAPLQAYIGRKGELVYITRRVQPGSEGSAATGDDKGK